MFRFHFRFKLQTKETRILLTMLVAVRERTGRERPIGYLVKITLEKKICVDLAGKTDREKPRRMSRKLKQKTFVIIGNRTQILLLPVANILPLPYAAAIALVTI